MEINEKQARQIRDSLHNLDITGPISNNFYSETLNHIIASGEGFSGKVYRDSKNKLTIGYGFNMDRGRIAETEWNQVFKGSLSFDDAKNGRIKLTKDQGKLLKTHSIMVREEELRKIYKPYWNNMRLNERAVITDMYYQSPKLVGRSSRFRGYINKYYETNDEDYLGLAVNEIKHHSSYSLNPLDIVGLQSRNNIRSIIFDSRNAPLYSKPYEDLIPEDKEIKIIIGETIIPRQMSEKLPYADHLGNYYIWRTRMDDKVRSSHRKLEGMVFSFDDDMQIPGEEYGCRCYVERLPINAKIIEKETKSLGGEDFEKGADIFNEFVLKEYHEAICED